MWGLVLGDPNYSSEEEMGVRLGSETGREILHSWGLCQTGFWSKHQKLRAKGIFFRSSVEANIINERQ